MAIKDSNSPVYATVTNEVKERLTELAQKNHRSLSQEIAYALDVYLALIDADIASPPKPGPKGEG